MKAKATDISTIPYQPCYVRIIGVEPTCLAAPDPKSGASANFAISANGWQK